MKHLSHTARSVTAGRLLTMNIRTGLAARRMLAKDLAFWCKRSNAWASRLLADKHEKIRFSELDRIADLFQIPVRDLFKPEPHHSPNAGKGSGKVSQRR